MKTKSPRNSSSTVPKPSTTPVLSYKDPDNTQSMPEKMSKNAEKESPPQCHNYTEESTVKQPVQTPTKVFQMLQWLLFCLQLFIFGFITRYICERAWGGLVNFSFVLHEVMKQLLHFLIVDIYNIVPWSCGAISVGVWGGLTSLNLELYEGIRYIIMYVLIVTSICRFISMLRYIDANYFKVHVNQFIENFWKQGGTLWEQSIVPTQFLVFPKIFTLIKRCNSCNHI